MRRQDVAAFIPLMQAYADGAEIQAIKPGYPDTWLDVEQPGFTLDPKYYRIKPAPVVEYFISFTATDSTMTYTWRAEESNYIRKLNEVTSDPRRKLLYIVKVTDNVPAIIEESFAAR